MAGQPSNHDSFRRATLNNATLKVYVGCSKATILRCGEPLHANSAQYACFDGYDNTIKCCNIKPKRSWIHRVCWVEQPG